MRLQYIVDCEADCIDFDPRQDTISVEDIFTYQSMNMCRAVIKEGVLKLFNWDHQNAVDKIMTDTNWQDEMASKIKQIFNEFWSLINSDKLDKVSKILVKGIRNSRLPLFICWQSVIPIIGMCATVQGFTSF